MRIIFIILVICTIGRGQNITDTSDSAICSKCHCLKQKKMLDCTYDELETLFAPEDWITLNKTGFVFNIVDFRYNKIKNVSVFEEIGIVNLDLSNNFISYIEKSAFEKLLKLENLDLSNNQLSSVNLNSEIFKGTYDPVLYQPLKIKSLNLGYNNLHTINSNLFEHLPFLEELNLSENPFKMLDPQSSMEIVGLSNIKVLNFSHMELSTIPADIFHTPRNLETLDLSGNLIIKIPQDLKYAINLKCLILNENPIIDLDFDNNFPKMSNLTHLSISYSRTLRIIGNGALSNLINLSSLEISNNINLNYIDANALSRAGSEDKNREEWPPIKILRINHNKLENLDSHLIGRWDELDEIDITNNPWNCNCDNQWLVDTLMPLVEAENKTKFVDGVVCEHPIEMKGKHLSELTNGNSKMRCLDAYGNRPERDSVILIAILSALLIGITFLFVLLWLYRNGYLAFCGTRGPADFSRAFYKRTGDGEEYY